MKNRILLVFCLTFAIILTACGTATSSGGSARYEKILKCEGRYVQRDEDSDDTYGLTFSFYEKDDNVYANIDYSNYMGTIRDGLVEDSADGEYLYEIQTKGDLYKNEQDFTILFNEEKLYISWGDGDCEYTLEKSSGSAEDEVDQTTPFEETEIYKTITESIDENFSSLDHNYEYNQDSKTFKIYVEAPAKLRESMSSNYDNTIDSWENVVDNMETMASEIYDLTQVGMGYEDVLVFGIYMVEELNDNNDYSESEIDLSIVNGKVKYDFAVEYSDESSGNLSSSSNFSGSNGSNNSSSDYGGSSSKSGSVNNYGSSSSSATAGEKNALERAKSYLDYTAFSYRSLIDQLEYEGYTSAEAEYAVDNCGADWYEQAVKKAEDYLDYSSFSKQELIEQLEYEGFTSDQASYGVSQAYH